MDITFAAHGRRIAQSTRDFGKDRFHVRLRLALAARLTWALVEDPLAHADSDNAEVALTRTLILRQLQQESGASLRARLQRAEREIDLAAGEAPAQTRLVMPLEEIVFPAPGTYLFQLHVGDVVELLCPLHLVENPDA